MRERDTAPVDPDVDLHVPRQRRELDASPWPVLGAVSAGGAIGALARYGLDAALPHGPGGFTWSTFTANVAGCLLIGVLMVLITEVWTGRPLLRPFLGAGCLGGFTTFGTAIVDVQRMVGSGAAATGLVHLAGTLLAALVAVWAGAGLTSLAVRRARAGRAVPAGSGPDGDRAGERR
ncbi:CrcB protein [Spinactinospora alkalitolerans]|uniref:Fluoride-specific ion channel FluC n=1 Tax=Spinactinospora alkalitolerans TaxID=687207 RepID=A0A852TN01_9ACTN|nr:CrcB family protein [Spinactinospora alkalitolerans]NYE44965.1 CrcB protein [Spinactinospora alkalitolerans]